MKKYILAIVFTVSLLAAGCGSAQTQEISGDVKEQEAAEDGREQNVSVEIHEVRETAETPEAADKTAVQPTETPAVPTQAPYIKQRAGLYYLNEMTQGSETMGLARIAQVEGYGVDMLLSLEEDGTGIMKVFGEAWEFTWDEAQFCFEKESSDYLWSEKTGISVVKDGTAYQFTTEKASDIIKALEEEKAAKRAEAKAEAEKKQEEKKENGEEQQEEGDTTLTFCGADWAALSGSDRKGLCIWYEFTNHTDGYLSTYAFRAEIIQDGSVKEEGGMELSDTEKIAEKDYRYAEVKPGGTCRSIHLFEADPQGGTVLYRVRLGDKVLIERELDPADLPGRPDGEFVPETVEDLSYLDEIPAKGIYNEQYEFAIDTAETVSVEDGEILRVKFKFSNGSDEAVSPYLALYLRAIQDGVSLNPVRSSEEDADPDLIYEEAEPGETVEFYYEWRLISESPVAVEAYDWFSGETLFGRPFEVTEAEPNAAETVIPEKS